MDVMRLLETGKRAVFPVLLALLLFGVVLYAYGRPDLASWAWLVGTALALTVLAAEIAANALRGEFALDVIAAIAMFAALMLGELLAGIVVAVMYSGGEALESFAQGRVKREMNALLERVPRSAARYDGDRIEIVDIASIGPGDLIVVRRGEVVPVDGTLCSTSATLDESTLTGEALPAQHSPGDELLSGATNAGDAFDIRATRSSADSTYAGIVRLVETAQKSKAPIMRLADRYALLFLAATLTVAGAAWIMAGDPSRALAVLVVATPCPLILAVPAAILSGVSYSARKGILVKGGAALERLARVDTVLLDKTGTITDGRARLVETKVYGDWAPPQVLRLVASLDQSSPHVIAEAIVAAAHESGLELETPAGVSEEPGRGIEGMVGQQHIAAGSCDYVLARLEKFDGAQDINVMLTRRGGVSVLVAVDRQLAGILFLADRVRPETPTVLRELRHAGINRIVLLTGDSADAATSVTAFLGLDDFVSDMKPEDKARVVQSERKHGFVMMVGDGVNDAPALAAADVGVAMGARGAAASSEAADVVILLDRLDRLSPALLIARRTRMIALQSAFAGMGLSIAAMAFAALGYLPPVHGAFLQEAIDIAVIMNALRALGGPINGGRAAAQLTSQDFAALQDEHRQLAGVIDEIRITADGMLHWTDEEIIRRLTKLDTLLRERLLPHEKHDEDEVYRRISGSPGQIGRLSGMSRTHMDIGLKVHNLGVWVHSLSSHAASASERRDIQHLLDGLEAIVRLHFDQEEEIYRSLETG